MSQNHYLTMAFFFCGWCLPKSQRTRRRKAFQRGPPCYRQVSRTSCPLFEACWNQDWQAVLARLDSHPNECFCQTSNNHRTALHLCTMPGANCPMVVLEALLDINPHAVLVHDSHQHGGTPLHFLCGSNHRNNLELVQLFVETAIQVEQQYYCREDGGRSNVLNLPFNAYNGYSPLYMACKKSAPVETLQILVDSRNRRTIRNRIQQTTTSTASSETSIAGVWIAPWTGGEMMDDETSLYHRSIFLSPLVELWSHVHTDFDASNLDTPTLERMREVTAQMLEEGGQRRIPSTLITTLHVDSPSSSAAAVESWAKCLVLLRPSVDSPCMLLHTVVRLLCPILALFQLVCKLYPEQLLQRDHSQQQQRGSSNGRIPLHVILLREWKPSVLQLLVKVSLDTKPECCQVVEPESSLYPCFLAAAQDAPLSVIYSLLQAFPLPVATPAPTPTRKPVPKRADETTNALV